MFMHNIILTKHITSK